MPNLHERRPAGGFTLIELMIAVAVVAILVSIALPSYTAYITRSNRSAAQSFMMDVANKEEQYMLDNRGYSDDIANNSEFSAKLNITVPTETNLATLYTFSVATDNSATPPTFTITAAPQGSQATNDTRCGTLTLNSAGIKTVGGSGTVGDCW